MQQASRWFKTYNNSRTW